MKFKLIEKRNPSNIEAPGKFYAQAIISNKINLKTLASRISRTTTMGTGDIYGVLMSLQEEIMDALKQGSSIELGDLCSFYPTIKSEGVENMEDFDAKIHLKKKGVRVSPKKEIKRQMSTVPLEKVE